MSITDDRARRVFALEISGLPVRYISGAFDASSSNLSANIATGIAYRDYEAIVSVGAYSGSIDPSGGVANYNTVSITLASSRTRGTLDDPAVIFGRCGARASGVTHAQLTSDIEYDVDAGSFTVDLDITSSIPSFPTLLHVGAETLVSQSMSTTTINFNQRAVARSQRQAHRITLDGTNVPEVSTAITTFRGRRASLWVAHQHFGSDELTEFTQIVNGFIESSPTVEEGGTVSLGIVPLTAMLDSQYAAKSTSTKLLHGFHYFESNRANVLEWAVALRDGGLNYHIFQASINPGAGTFILNDDLNPFWFNAPTDLTTGFDRCHPRYPLLKGADVRIYPTAGSAQNITYDVANSTPLLISVYDPIPVSTSSEPEIKAITIGSDEIKPWPEVISEELENYGPSSAYGVDGAWARWNLSPDEQVTVRPTRIPNNAQPQIILSTSGFSRIVLNGTAYQPRRWSQYAVYESLDRRERLWYPIDIRAPESSEPFDNYPIGAHVSTRRVINAPDDPSIMTAREPLSDIARGFYQWRERQILVERELEWLPSTATAGVVFWIQVKYHNRATGEPATQMMKATHQTVATYDGSTVGYLIHLDPRQNWSQLASFGDWAEGDRVEIFAAAQFDRERPAELMLKLLQSGGGDQKNGTYDVLSLGLGIDAAYIDINSFLSYDQTSPFVFSGSISSDGLVLRDLIDSLLKAMGCVIIMARRGTAESRITLQPIGADRIAFATASIAAGDWHSDQPPTWSIYEDVITQTEIRYDYDTQEKRFGVEAIYNNQEAINRYGGERSKLTIDLYALTSADVGGTAGDTFGFFLPAISRIWNLLSNPLRLWRGSIGSGKSLLLDVGSYVSVSSPLLKGYGDEWGVTNQVGMIQSLHQELMSEGARVDIIATGASPVAWNSTAEVDAIPTSTSVEVAEYSYSSTDPDVSFFSIGDVVDYLPEGNHDSAITGLVIAQIQGNIIGFTSAHGITVTGGTLEPTIYTNASADMQADAYLSSDTSPPVLGLNVEAQRYS